MHFYVQRQTPRYSSCALLMTCNLSSYQILTNSILFHWLLFISIDHRCYSRCRCRHHTYIFFVISFTTLYSPRFFSHSMWKFVFVSDILFFRRLFCILHFLCILLVRNYIGCFVSHLLYTYIFFFKGNHRQKPMVKPNKLQQQLFMFLLFCWFIFFLFYGLRTLVI